MSLFSNIPILDSLSSTQLLSASWVLVFLIFLIVSIALSYQWRHYGIQNSNLRFAEFIYYVFSIFFLGFAALSIILFNAHL